MMPEWAKKILAGILGGMILVLTTLSALFQNDPELKLCQIQEGVWIIIIAGGLGTTLTAWRGWLLGNNKATSINH
jgi:hypothetical protein